MMDEATRERLERAKKLLARAPTKTEATTEALEEFRAGLRGQAGNTTPEHTAAEWDELLRQTRALL